MEVTKDVAAEGARKGRRHTEAEGAHNARHRTQGRQSLLRVVLAAGP